MTKRGKRERFDDQVGERAGFYVEGIGAAMARESRKETLKQTLG